MSGHTKELKHCYQVAEEMLSDLLMRERADARKQALEEAYRVCDRAAHDARTFAEVGGDVRRQAAWDLACSIRALKDNP